MNTTAVTSENTSGILTIRLNRPAKLNAMNAELLNGVAEQLGRAASDSEVKVIVITGNGRAFCAGGDLTTTLDERRTNLVSTVSMSMRTVEVFSLMEWIPKPVIAAVNGDTYAGGMGFILYSDLAIASDAANFCCPMATRGLYEPYTATRLAARIGVERTKYMLLTAQKVSATKALDWGMISEVHRPEDLAAATEDLAGRLRDHDPFSLREYKYAVRRTLPGFDLGTFINEAVAPETGAIMEEFARQFPANSSIQEHEARDHRDS